MHRSFENKENYEKINQAALSYIPADAKIYIISRYFYLNPSLIHDGRKINNDFYSAWPIMGIMELERKGLVKKYYSEAHFEELKTFVSHRINADIEGYAPDVIFVEDGSGFMEWLSKSAEFGAYMKDFELLDTVKIMTYTKNNSLIPMKTWARKGSGIKVDEATEY